MIRLSILCIAILTAAATATGSLPEGIAIIPVPVFISDSLVFSFDDTEPASDELVSELGLSELPFVVGHSSQYISGRIEIEGAPLLLLLFQNHTEEISGWLVSCSDDGGIIDYLYVYYWNSEGFASRTGFVGADGTVVVNEWLIDESGGSTEIDTVSLREDGFFEVNGNILDHTNDE